MANNERISADAAFNLLMEQAEELRRQFEEVTSSPDPDIKLMRAIVDQSQKLVDEMEALVNAQQLPKRPRIPLGPHGRHSLKGRQLDLQPELKVPSNRSYSQNYNGDIFLVSQLG